MTQAIGALGRIAYVEESVWGTTPGSPQLKLIKAGLYGESLSASIEELMSNAVNGSRAVENVIQGNIDVKGAVPIELPLLGIGTLLKHALGTVNTSGAGPYTHVIKRGALPAGLTLEKGFTDIGQYIVFTGCRIDKLSLSVSPQGLVTGSLDIIGKDFSASGTPLDASVDTVVHTPFVHHQATFEEGGSAATLLNLNLNLTNGLEPVRVIGSRTIGALPEGKGEITGDITVMFENLTLFNKWKNGTATSLKATFTSGAHSIEFYLPSVRYNGEAVPKIASDRGVVVPLSFRAIYDSGEATDLKVTLVNTEATI